MPLEFTPLTGAGPDVRVIDPGGAPVTIIDTDDTPTIRVRWSVEEPGAAVLGGRWLVRAYAESIGPGQGAGRPDEVRERRELHADRRPPGRARL